MIIMKLKSNGAFRFWCQTVLPLTFDDSLSYYELLNKVVFYLNNCVKDINTLTQLVESFETYFDNLDVQEEINNKLDEMAADGTLDNIINNNLFSTLNNNINTLVETKVNKTDTSYVTMDKLSQDVREALVGGGSNIPVVGTNAVDTVNIQNHAVTRTKLDYGVIPVWFLDKAVVINKEEQTIFFPVGFAFMAGDATVICSTENSYTLSYADIPTNRFYWLCVTPPTSETDAIITLTENRVSDAYVLGRLFNGVVYWSSPANVQYSEQSYNNTILAATELRGKKIRLDMQQMKIIFPRETNLLYSMGGNYIIFNTTDPNGSGYLDDITFTTKYGALCFDKQTNNFVVKSAMANLTDRYFILGIWNVEVNFCHFIIPYEYVTRDTNTNESTTTNAPYNTVKEIDVIGDSITAGAGTLTVFETIVEHLYGIRLLNWGIGSTGYAFNLPVTNDHISGNGTTARGTVQPIPAGNSFYNRLYTKFDVGSNPQLDTASRDILIFGGTNDWSNNMSIATFKTAVENTIKLCLSNGHNVGIISPLRRWRETTPALAEWEEPTNTIGLTVKDYADTIKECCDELGVPYLDLYNMSMSPLCTAIRNKYFVDGIHPNDLGHYRLAVPIAEFVKKYFIACNKND